MSEIAREEREAPSSVHELPRALVVASDAAKRRQLSQLLGKQGLRVRDVDSVPRAWELIGDEPFDLVVPVDDVLHGPGKELISEIRAFDDATAVVAVVDSAECSRRALAAGAYDVFVPPMDDARLAVVVGHVAETVHLRERSAVLARMMNGGAHIGALLTRDPHMIGVIDSVQRLARYQTPVLVVGERGTEHEEVARELHRLGRPDGPFVVTKATGLSVAELRARWMEAADGTLFIDDVTLLPADVAAALSGLIEDAPPPQGRPARVVARCPHAACPILDPGKAHADLHRHFREAVLVLSPLRERRGDAVLVARELAAGIGRDRGRELALTRGVEDVLSTYAWPGNMDELRSVMVAAATTSNGPAIDIHDLPAPLADQAGGIGQAPGTRLLRDLEMQHLRQVLEETRGNKSRAARILGLSRWALQRKLRKHGISYGEADSDT